MAEEKERSLDQQIKEAELAKLKAETADIEKQSKQARVMGVPIVQIIFGPCPYCSKIGKSING